MSSVVLGLRRVAVMAHRQAQLSKRLGFIASVGATGFAAVTVLGYMASPGGWVAAGASGLIAVFGSYAASTARQRQAKAEAALLEISTSRSKR